MSVVSLAQGTSSDWLTSELKASIENKVFDREFGAEGLESLSQVLCELGAASKGYLGVLLCPYGSKKVPGKSGHYLYKRTVPVWVLRNLDSAGKLRFLKTSEFALWIKNSVLYNSGISFRGAASNLGGILGNRSATVLPCDSVSQVGSRVIPLPSTVNGGYRRPVSTPIPSQVGIGGRIIPPPSTVNTITGDHPSYKRDSLSQAEAEFVDCPKNVNDQGQKVFDPVEFERRADALDAARAARGLPGIGLATPSIYRR